MYLYRTAVRIIDGYHPDPRFTAKVFRTTPPDDKFDAVDIEFYVDGGLFDAKTFAVNADDDLFFLKDEVMDYLFDCEMFALAGDEHFARGWDSITC